MGWTIGIAKTTQPRFAGARKGSVMKELILTTLVIAGAHHLADNRDLSGLEIGVDDLNEAIGRIRSDEWPLSGDKLILTLGMVREEIAKILEE